MRLILAVLPLIASGPVWAEWERFATTDQVVHYIDPKSIQQDGDIRRVWWLHDLKTRDQDGEMSRRGLEEINCKAKRHRTIAGTTHSGPMATENTLINIGAPDTKWLDMVPNSLGEYMLSLVCGRR